MFSNRYGLNALVKDGGRVFSGVAEVALKNIDACRTLSQITQTSLGPNSMNKMIINHLDKKFVTSDAAIMVNELDVQHPAAKILIQTSKMQENEFGDATNFIIVFGGELLNQAESLIKTGLHTVDIIKGYALATEKCVEFLDECVCWTLNNPRNQDELQHAIKTSISSKQLSDDAKLSSLVAQATMIAMPTNPQKFDIDHIRVCKLTGGSIDQSYTLNGMVIQRDAEGQVKKKVNAKVMVLTCGLEMTGTEATSTVLIKNAQELIDFTKGEEDMMERLIKQIKGVGVDVIICNGSISETAQHFCNKFEIFVLRVTSKFEIRRICLTLGATPIVRLGAPLADEMGCVESIEVLEISSKMVTVIKAREAHVATIVLRGATKNVLDELERSIDDGVACVKAALKDGQFVAGGAATEIQLATKIQTFGSSVSGLDQYSVLAFAKALEIIPKVISDNAGYNSVEMLTKLYASHEQGDVYTGINTLGPDMLLDACAQGILDHKETKKWAIKLTSEAILNILKVDQIVMAKPAGGPGPREPGPGDQD